MLNILICEDDNNTRRLTKDILIDAGYNVFLAVDGVEGLNVFDNNHIDLILIDYLMPKLNGIQLVTKLRSEGCKTPIIMMSCMGELSDVKRGLISGVDDYMIKPCDDEELLLRIKALLRRSELASERVLKINNVTLDYNTFSVYKHEEFKQTIQMQLPKKEFLLLFKLLSNPNKVYTRDQLLDEIWGILNDSYDNTVNVHINKLRNRFKDLDDFSIKTIRGVGYCGSYGKKI